METVIKIVGRIAVNQSIENVLFFLKNLKNIALYEPKLISVNLIDGTGSVGMYQATGKFLGLSWQGKFNYELHEYGFHSMMIEGLLADKVQGGFSVQSIASDRSLIIHYEEYKFPIWTIVLKPLLYIYLHYSMNKELKNLSTLVE